MPCEKAVVEVEFDGEKMLATNHCAGNVCVFEIMGLSLLFGSAKREAIVGCVKIRIGSHPGAACSSGSVNQ
jgi:hypothetical protein